MKSPSVLRFVFGDLAKGEVTAIVGINMGEMEKEEMIALTERIEKENPWLQVDPLQVPEDGALPYPGDKVYPRRVFLKLYNLPKGVQNFGLHAHDRS